MTATSSGYEGRCAQGTASAQGWRKTDLDGSQHFFDQLMLGAQAAGQLSEGGHQHFCSCGCGRLGRRLCPPADSGLPKSLGEPVCSGAPSHGLASFRAHVILHNLRNSNIARAPGRPWSIEADDHQPQQRLFLLQGKNRLQLACPRTLKRPFLWASLLGRSPLSLGGLEPTSLIAPSMDICSRLTQYAAALLLESLMQCRQSTKAHQTALTLNA